MKSLVDNSVATNVIQTEADINKLWNTIKLIKDRADCDPDEQLIIRSSTSRSFESFIRSNAEAADRERMTPRVIHRR